jgi:hypothetical protein
MRRGGAAEGLSRRCSESDLKSRPMHLFYALLACLSLIRTMKNVLKSRKYFIDAPALLVAFPMSIWPSSKTV